MLHIGLKPAIAHYLRESSNVVTHPVSHCNLARPSLWFST